MEMLQRGENPQKYNYVDETLFSSIEEITEVKVDGVTYRVDKDF